MKELNQILTEVATVFGLTPEDILMRTRKRYITESRHAFCLKANRLGYSKRRISTFLNVDRTTVIYGCKNALRLMHIDGDYRTKYMAV